MEKAFAQQKNTRPDVRRRPFDNNKALTVIKNRD
jgi:hypothetical protein